MLHNRQAPGRDFLERWSVEVGAGCKKPSSFRDTNPGCGRGRRKRGGGAVCFCVAQDGTWWRWRVGRGEGVGRR